MAVGRTVDIPFLLSQEEIASSFLKHLPAGELITLARTNSVLRAELHDFGEPHPQLTTSTGVRHELQIGHHETARWKKLKANAPYECSSPTHTKGTDVKPCRYCSKLICSACMARASFKNPGEKTFQNRSRSFCDSCWTSGNRHKREKITDDCFCHDETRKAQVTEAQEATDVAKTCECTNKNDGWVCLECKDLQNRVWGSTICFGEGCTNRLDGSAERRKICMWCNKPLPITATRENPHVYKQKVVDAMAREAASRQADAEEYAKRRRNRLKMTRRELRGEEAAFDDVPQYIRHLDTVNYIHLIGRDRVPTSGQVYNSKQGKWQYSLGFLLAFRTRCNAVPIPSNIKEATKSSSNNGERTNRDLFEQEQAKQKEWEEGSLGGGMCGQHWDDHQDQIMRMRYIEGRSASYIQSTMHKEHGLWGSEQEYRQLVLKWTRNAELESSRLGTPSQDRSRYWHDLGSSAARGQGLISSRDASRMSSTLHETARTSSLRDSHATTHSARMAMQYSTADEALLTTNAQHSTSQNDHEMVVNGPDSTAARSATAQVLQDLERRQSALHSRNPSNSEEVDQLLAEQTALQMEWEEALTTEARDAGTADMALDDSDDVNMLIAIQESLNEAPQISQNESRPDGRPPVYFE